MTRPRMLVAAVTFGLLFAACGGAGSSTDTTASTGSSETTNTATEQALLSGVFDTVSGSQIDFGSFEGQDTVLWFWAPW